MSDVPSDPPWEPPLAGSEIEHLLGALDRQRWTFRWKADGLDAAGLEVRVGSSALTLGGLLKHLAAVEELASSWQLAGEEPDWPTDPRRWRTAEGWEETLDPQGATPAELYALYDGAVERSRARFAGALDRGGLDQDVHSSAPNGQHANLRRLLFDKLEEYARHTGHADLLREAVDGRVGEDPPNDWRPS
jgi:Protein of unknown function (DUF664)